MSLCGDGTDDLGERTKVVRLDHELGSLEDRQDSLDQISGSGDDEDINRTVGSLRPHLSASEEANKVFEHGSLRNVLTHLE